MKLRHHNRIKERTAPFRRHWCHRCDGRIVEADARCKCGYRNETKRLKKFGIKPGECDE